MAAGAALPGLFFTIAAMVLLIFASIAVPVWDNVSYLNAGTGASATRFGIFGFTGSDTHVGYHFPNSLPQVPFGNNGDRIFRGLSGALILIPIAAGLSALAFVFGLCGIGGHRFGTVFMTLLTALATLVTFVAVVIELVLFVSTRQILHHDNVPATLGNANWLVLGAFIALLLAAITSCLGSFGRYRSHRNNY